MSLPGNPGTSAVRTRANSRVRPVEDEISLSGPQPSSSHIEPQVHILEDRVQDHEKDTPDVQVPLIVPDRVIRGEGNKSDIHRDHLKQIKEADSPNLFKCAKDILHGLKLRASGVNAIMRSIKSIQDQLNLVYSDIQNKKNPSGEGVQGSVSFINEERKSLMDQIKDLRNFILHIDSALNLLNEEDTDGVFEADI